MEMAAAALLIAVLLAKEEVEAKQRAEARAPGDFGEALAPPRILESLRLRGFSSPGCAVAL